jgi:hypothetical protein
MSSPCTRSGEREVAPAFALVPQRKPWRKVAERQRSIYLNKEDNIIPWQRKDETRLLRQL